MIKKGTIEYRLISLIGLAGEMPAEALYKLNYGNEYIRKVLSNLSSKGYIKAYKSDDIKCLRLTIKCKRYLTENYPERFGNMFTGATRTNKIRNEANRRTRYHRLGEILVLLSIADVKIFADEKTLMEKTHGFTRADTADFADYSVDKNTAEFYTSTELKTTGFFMNARTSRALGIIYSYPDVYIIYNFADEVLKMEYKTEHSFFFTAGHTFNRILRNNLHAYAKMIFVGNNMELMQDILKAKSGAVKKLLNLSNEGDNIFFLDNSTYAPEQLKYIINKEKRDNIKESIYSHFGAVHKMRHTALTPDRKTTVLDCTSCNLPAIKSVKDTEVETREDVKIVCFDFQTPYIHQYLGDKDNVEYYRYNIAEIPGTE